MLNFFHLESKKNRGWLNREFIFHQPHTQEADNDRHDELQNRVLPALHC